MNRSEKSDILSEGFKRLEELLDTQCSHYRRVEELVAQQKDALRVADVDSLSNASNAERELLGAISRLDHRRVELVEAIASELGLKHSSQPTLSDLLEHSGPRRGRLVTIADELRRLIAATRVASSVVRTAAESLARHMQGIVQSVEVGIGRTGIYGRTGRLVSALPRHTSINIRS